MMNEDDAARKRGTYEDNIDSKFDALLAEAIRARTRADRFSCS